MLKKGGRDVDLLSPCSGDENLSDEDDDTPAATPLCSIRTPLSHYPNLQKTQSATHARVGWKKVDFLLSPSFWAEIFSEQPPRGVVPAARSTGRRIPVTTARRKTQRKTRRLHDERRNERHDVRLDLHIALHPGRRRSRQRKHGHIWERFLEVAQAQVAGFEFTAPAATHNGSRQSLLWPIAPPVS